MTHQLQEGLALRRRVAVARAASDIPESLGERLGVERIPWPKRGELGLVAATELVLDILGQPCQTRDRLALPQQGNRLL